MVTKTKFRGARVVIRSYLPPKGGWRRWQWRCTWYGFTSGLCPGSGTDIVAWDTAREAARVHAWTKHGVRL